MSEKGKVIKCTLLEFHDADEFWDKLVMVDGVITSLPTPNSVTDIPVNTTNNPTQSFTINEMSTIHEQSNPVGWIKESGPIIADPDKNWIHTDVYEPCYRDGILTFRYEFIQSLIGDNKLGRIYLEQLRNETPPII